MHSLIYQISDEPINKEAYISTDHIEAGDMAYIDYTHETEENERKTLIKELAERILPKGMFTVSQDGETLTYQGGFAEWRKSYIQNILTKAATITEENVMKWIGPTYQLQMAVVNPLDTGTLFVIDFDTYSALAERSREFMTMIERLDKGAQLYIGTIAGYHF